MSLCSGGVAPGVRVQAPLAIDEGAGKVLKAREERVPQLRALRVIRLLRPPLPKLVFCDVSREHALA
jgi:hypothetical protein